MRRFVLPGMMLAAALTARADFTDNFSSLDPAWIPDRYAPAGFNSTMFDGDYRLGVTISPQDSAANRPSSYSDPFYNTQGRQRSVDVTGAWWSLTAQTYVGADTLSGNGLRRTDLWASTGQNGNENTADYFIIGTYHFDPADALNGNSPNITSGWRVFNDMTGWVYLASPLTLGWHGVGVYYDAASNQATYTIDGNVVYTVEPSGGYADHLRTVDVQAYNFGQAAGYTAYWDNVQVQSPPLQAVPEPASLSFAIMGFVACLIIQRNRNLPGK
jgi:hypothetical protein